MTAVLPTQRAAIVIPVEPRLPTRRRYLMCPPAYFTVSYSINPWMDPDQPVSTELAIEQWTTLKQTYQELGQNSSAETELKAAASSWDSNLSSLAKFALCESNDCEVECTSSAARDHLEQRKSTAI